MARLRNFHPALAGLALLLVGISALAMQTAKLSSGGEMPMVGLGTWQVDSKHADQVITDALENGYRLIDTAFIYNNEAGIGQALKKWFDKGGKRQDLFVTTKLPPAGNREADVETYLKYSLDKLGLNYVDLYLVHMPMGFLKEKNGLNPMTNADGSLAMDYATDHVSLWKAMEKQVRAGRAKAIGVSNFNQSQIENVLKVAEIKPAVLEIELQAYNQQKELRKFCKEHNIQITAYSSLGSPATQDSRKTSNFKSQPKLLQHPVVLEIAKAHGKSAVQVLLRHQVQNGIAVIPKSSKLDHLKQNIQLFDFELTPAEMAKLDGLDLGENGRLFNFLSIKGVEKHPQYPWTHHLPKP